MEASMQMSTLIGHDAHNRQWQLLISFSHGLRIIEIRCEELLLASDLEVVGPWPQPNWYQDNARSFCFDQSFGNALWKPGIEKSRFIAYCQDSSWEKRPNQGPKALFESWIGAEGVNLKLSYTCATEALIGWRLQHLPQVNRLHIHSLIDKRAKVYQLVGLQLVDLLPAGTDEVAFTSHHAIYHQFCRDEAIRGVGTQLQVRTGSSGWKVATPSNELSLLVQDDSLVVVSASDPLRPKLSASSLEVCFFKDAL